MKSEKDKRLEVLNKLVAKITNAINNKNFTELHDDFAVWVKEVKNADRLFEKIGQPQFVIEIFAKIEDSVNEKYEKLNALNKKN